MTNGNRNLEGKTLVVTGKLEGMTRQDAEAMIFDHGGNPASSVTRVTDYLVVGKKPGSKLSKAKQLGTEILDQDQFKALLEAGAGASVNAASNLHGRQAIHSENLTGWDEAHP